MEKRGVCDGEGDAPKPTEKAAQDQTKIGGDLLSKMSEQAASTGQTVGNTKGLDRIDIKK